MQDRCHAGETLMLARLMRTVEAGTVNQEKELS
jgi:hypothetical protein